MTKVKKNLLRLALKNHNYLLAVKLSLLANIESNNGVYIPNAQSMLNGHLNKNQVAGYLSVLEKQGFCRSEHDGYFTRIV